MPPLSAREVVARIAPPPGGDSPTVKEIRYQLRLRKWSWFDPTLTAEPGILQLPDWQFCATRRVDDDPTPRFEWDGKTEHACACDFVSVRNALQECDALLIESPHRSEYADRGRGEALGPLRDTEVNRVVLNRLPGLLEKVARHVPDGVAGGFRIAVVNAVQYQTSLAACTAKPRCAINKAVRDRTWHALFDLPEIRDDLDRRLRKMAPRLILVASTSRTQDRLVAFLRERSFRFLALDRHPSGWWRAEPKIVPL
ncbi:conserved protein of unknown function (plasmid) [Rhodovastum atsumiense]|uniref:Uncharacterized protein n=1 Tax=Rhodovastum atsumiense TaxID=504468 RepID=A0A5M6IUC1_9PROT|nr:hypothetical protein [Rhodovastum atsumiense]KAA5611831.1 hypothetical protein F1189_12400 [Rhodovastum atsumiense]CAH2606057.1 conserved protein of unknown function [Rhodovastum atsumiense]